MDRWARALKKYKKGVELIEHDDQFSPEEKKVSADIKKLCNLNLAATYLKVNDSKEARKACNKVCRLRLCLPFVLSRGVMLQSKPELEPASTISAWFWWLPHLVLLMNAMRHKPYY